MPAVNVIHETMRPAMFLVAGGVMSSYVGEVVQAVPAAMSQVLRWHMRTRLYSQTSLIRTLKGGGGHRKCPLSGLNLGKLRCPYQVGVRSAG